MPPFRPCSSMEALFAPEIVCNRMDALATAKSYHLPGFRISHALVRGNYDSGRCLGVGELEPGWDSPAEQTLACADGELPRARPPHSVPKRRPRSAFQSADPRDVATRPLSALNELHRFIRQYEHRTKSGLLLLSVPRARCASAVKISPASSGAYNRAICFPSRTCPSLGVPVSPSFPALGTSAYPRRWRQG
jgi:hypothetical protein